MDIIKEWTNMKQWIFIFLLHYIVLSLCKEQFKYLHCVLHRNRLKHWDKWMYSLRVETQLHRNYTCAFPLGGTTALTNTGSQIWIILLEDYYAQIDSPSGCLGELWYWGWSFYGCFAPFPSRPGTFAILAGHQGTGRYRRGDLAKCLGWSDHSIGDRWGKWSAQIHTARQSAARTQICIRPRGDMARTQRWSWRWSRPGCPRFCAARGQRGKEIVGVSHQCERRCS